MPPTIAQSLNQAVALLAAQPDVARLDAELLLAHVLDTSRTHLHTWPEKTLSPPQHASFQALLARRQAGEPVAYLTGHQGFWTLDLQVGPATLIPRPETELLVEQALARIPASACWRIADLGTGSGAIALALASERPHSHLTATDISETSLAIARANAEQHGLDNVAFLESHWFASLGPAPRWHMIVSNPPYIAVDDPHLHQGDVRFEPSAALVAGPDGLDALRQIIAQARDYLAPGGWLLLEHGHDQQNAVQALMQQGGYRDIRGYADLAGQPRVVAGRHPA